MNIFFHTNSSLKMESIPEIDASPTVDSEDKHKHVCLKEQKEQHNLDRSLTHPKQLVQSGEDEGSLSRYGWSHDPGEVVQYSNIPEGTTLPNVASTEDRHTPVNTSGEHACRISSEPSLNPESLLEQEISDNSSLPTQNADRQPTVISEDAGTVTNTYGYNTERISRKQWKAINIFVLDVEQKIIASNKWLQFSEAIGYDMSVERKKIGSEPKQFYKLLNEWITVMKETERNPIPYLKWALEEVDEEDLVTKLIQKFGSTHDIHDEDMDQLQTQLTSRDFSITVKPYTNEGQTIIQAATVVMGDRNVVTKVEGETKTANGCDRQLTEPDSKENQSQDFANNLSSNVVDGPGETTGAIGPFDDVPTEKCGFPGLMIDGKQVVFSKLKYSAIVGQTCVIKVNIDDKYRHDHLIWRWKRNKEEEYTKGVSHSEKYNIGNVENPSLTINCVQKTDEGYYRCQVVNAAGSVNSEDIFLEILGGIPKAIVNVEGKVIRGTTVILHCEITSVPDFTSLTWLKNGDAITMTINNTKYNGGTNHKPSLTINNVDNTDKAVYTCEVTNLAGTGTSNAVTFNIINKPTVRIDGAALVLTGRTTTIGCTVSSPESVSELTWFKDVNKSQLALNSSKYGGGSIQTPSLTIRNINDKDKASYRCEATNIAGTGQSKVVHLDVAGKPTIYLSYKSTVLRGNKSMIDCSVTSKIPIISLQWYKDGQRILSTSVMFSGGSIEEPSLTLNNFSKQHEGKYRCEVSNGAGTVSSDDAVIDIGDMPVISLTSLTYTVKAAGFVTLRCQIAGNPKPEIQWYRLVDGEKHIVKESLKYSGGTVKVPSLTITNVDGNDTGSYILNAHNAFGESWSEKVAVKGELPRITLNSDASVLFGKAITIVCLLESDIQTLNWFKDDCELSLDNKHFIGGKLDSPHLTITAASKSDEGKYTCKGITQFGTTISNTISIMVLFDTPQVTIDESNISTEAGASIQLKCSIISEPSITRINWYKTENGKSSQISYSGRHTGGSIQQPFLSIMNANPNDSGVYFCEVENIAGKGRSRNIHLEIKEALPVISISKNLEGRENQPIKLICNIKSGLPVQSLIWYKEVDGRQREIFENGIKYEGGHSRIPELTILHCDKTDTGFYICRVANSFGQSSSEKCFLQVSYKPVITVPLEKNVMDGQSVDIDCSVDAKPDIDSLQWYRLIDGQFIELQQTSKNYTGGNKRNPSLSIVNIGKYDEGAYRCRASNSVGECLSDNCQLKVSSKPEVLIEHSTLSCKIGQSISIECRVQADPAVQHVQWLKKDKGKGKQGKITQLKQTKNETFEHSIKPSLTIRDVQKTDSGHYFCEATNIAGTTKSEPIVLDVATNISETWFYKLVICCDGRMVNVDSCESTSICRNNVKLFYDVKSKGQSELSSYLHTLLRTADRDLEILVTFSTLLKSNLIRPEDWLLTVISHQHGMACYMLLAYMTGTDTENENIIIPALKMAIEKDDRNITNTISWFIIREFLKSLSFRIDSLLDIWPAVVCKNMKCYKSVFCSNELVIVVEMVESTNNMPIKFWNVKIKYLVQSDGKKLNEKVNQKDCMNTKSTEDCFPEKFEIDGYLASELFKLHSKLTFICKSMYKLIDGAKVNGPCVQLFCRRKGFIPVKESHFPKYINNVKTDILEGEPILARKIRTGDQIKSEYSIGTLGGFVKILGDTTFLTCAHVVVHKDVICSKKMSIPNNKAINIECEQTSSNSQEIFICGRVRNYEFKTNREGETSIDAALITLKEGIEIDADDFISNSGTKHTFKELGMKSLFLDENCLDYEKFFYGKHFSQFTNVTVGAISGVCVNGSKIDVPEDKDEGVHIDLEKYMETYNRIIQSETQNTAHSSTFNSTAPVFSNNAHTQETRLLKVDHERTLKRLSRCMYNQIAVTKVPFKPGDSGTCVYVCDNSLQIYGCMGMAIANHPGIDGGAILTPMKEILKTFHVDIQ